MGNFITPLNYLIGYAPSLNAQAGGHFKKEGLDVTILPGKGEQSLLYQLAGKRRRPLMPPKTEMPLTPEELATIKLWIDQGAKAPTGAPYEEGSCPVSIIRSSVPNVGSPV